jgi:hypothetical protein
MLPKVGSSLFQAKPWFSIVRGSRSRRLAFHSSKMAAVVRVMPLDEITQEAHEAVLV